LSKDFDVHVTLVKAEVTGY